MIRIDRHFAVATGFVLTSLLCVHADVHARETAQSRQNVQAEATAQTSSAGNRQAAEAARIRTVRGLIERREKLVRTNKTRELQACDAQIRRYPMPSDSDPRESTRLLVGKWRSPRHDYLYRANGSWTLLPAEAGDLHGTWRIVGNRLEETSGYAKTESSSRYTLVLLTREDLVFTDGESVFCEKRIQP